MTSLPDWDGNWDEQENDPSPSLGNRLHSSSSDNATHSNVSRRDSFFGNNNNIIDHPNPYASTYISSQNDIYGQIQGFVDEKLLLSSASGDDEEGMPYLRSAGHKTANVDLRPEASSWTSRRAQDGTTMAASNNMDATRTMNMDAMKRVNFNSYPAPHGIVSSKVGMSNKHSQIKNNSHTSGNTKDNNYHAESMMFHEPLSYSSLQQGSDDLIASSSSSSSTNDRQQQRDRRRHHDTAATGSSYSYSRVDLPTFDEFRCREVCLSASNKIKVVHDYLRDVKRHILQERTFTAENVKLLSSPFASDIQRCTSRTSHDDSSLHSSIGIPKEVLSVKHYSMDVQGEVFECMKAVAECFDHRTNIYLGQLKKVRDLSNSATRNVIQYERAEACLSLQKMKSSYDQQLEAELSKYKESNEKLQAEVVVLGSRIEAMVDEMKQLRELDRDRLEQQNNAVSAMRTQCSEEQKAHFEQLQRTSMVEKDQLRQDAQRVLAEVKQQHEMNLRMEKEHSDKLQDLLRRDKEVLELECEKLRKELLSVNATLTVEKEVFASRLREEKYNADKEHRMALSEALKTQAQLKNEMMAMVARLQSDDHRKNAELEVKMNKFRESLLVTHTLEIDKLNDRHRAEMQKFVADGQIKLHDNVVKLKHMHEQELNRLLRDNDRLQRIIIRHGGAEHFRTMHATDSNSVDHSHSLSETSQRQQPNHQGSSSSAVPVVFRTASPQRPSLHITIDKEKEEEDSSAMTRSHHSNLASKLPIYSSRIRDSLTPSGRSASQTSSNRGDDSEVNRAVKESSSKSVSFQMDADPPPPPPIPPSLNTAAADNNTNNINNTNNNSTNNINNNNNNNRITSRTSNAQDSRPMKSRTSGLNWGALEQSLSLQEQQEQSSQQTAAFKAPPDQFELNEALAISMAKQQTSSNGVGLSIESNVDRVNTYMNKLEAYLKGSKALLNVPNDATDEASADDHPNLDTTSNSSVSNMSFNSQVAYKYLKAKEMLGILSSSSSSSTAALDGSDYISDDSDSSDSLDRHLIQT